METKEWKYVDKSKWTRGTWDNEPDKIQWEDKETGLPCMVRRGGVGQWCGYVGIAPKHPLYKKDWEDCYDNGEINVHGGLTFSRFCDGNEETGICHVPNGGEKDVWWLGFDCGHLGDLAPGMISFNNRMGLFANDTYKNIEYVKNETSDLARQLKQIETEAK